MSGTEHGTAHGTTHEPANEHTNGHANETRNETRYDAGSVSTREAVLLVARREVTTRARSRSFLISTFIMLIAVVGGVLLVQVFGGPDKTTDIGVTDAAFARPLTAAARALDQDVTVRTVPDEATGTRQVRDGELDVLIAGPAQAPRAVVEREIDAPVQAMVTGIARQAALDQQIQRLGGDPAKVGAAVAAVRVDVVKLDPLAEGYGERVGVSMFAGILVYIALIVYGQAVAQGVVEEKASRIVELLLTTIRPWQLMLGKVLGIGVVGLIQMLVTLGAGAAATQATGAFTIPASVVTSTAAWSLAWFLVGFLMYALMFAAAGALVSRQEDASSVVTPVMMLIIVPYVIGITALPSDPDSGLSVTLSLIPLFSPTLMPMRMALGVPGWQVALSLVLSVLLIGVLVWLSGRIYRNAVLRTGTRVKLGEAFRDA